MGIEQDIQQKAFKNPHQKAAINVMFTASFLSLQAQQLLKTFDLTLPQFNILRILRGQHPKSTTVNILIDRMIDKSSNASRIVEKLRAKQLVERKVCENDRRAVDVTITPSGLDLLQQIDSEEKHFFLGLHSLSNEEAEQLSALLDKGRLNKES
jgi:DNA-binding MarR family transcriptional regulator